MSNVDWSADARNAFGLFIRFNSFLGMWPPIEVDLRLKIRFIIAIIELIIMATCILYEMSQNCSDAEDSLDSLLVITSAVISLSKLIFCYVHREKLTVNIKSAIQDWSSIETIKYRSVMAQTARIYKIFTYLYGTTIFSDGILLLIKILLINPDKLIEITSIDDFKTNVTQFVPRKRYPFPSTCTFDGVSDTVYHIVVLNQLIQLITCSFIVIGSDTIFFAITAHLCGQFKILKIRFANVGIESSLSVATTTTREKMVALITRHQEMFSRMEVLEEAYNKIILIQLTMSISFASAAGFALVIAIKTNDFFVALTSFVVMQSMFLQLFMYTSVGEALQNSSDDIIDSVYDGSWYELPRYLCKDLLFIMMRSSVSPRLTAGKFFYMTRATFMKIVKITFSYISALQLMLDE